jgi:hypothetical protein
MSYRTPAIALALVVCWLALIHTVRQPTRDSADVSPVTNGTLAAN